MRSLLVLFLVVASPLEALAQWDSAETRTVAPGIVHRRLVVNAGPWRMNVLEVDLRTPGLRILGVRANDAFKAREKLTSMAARHQSVVAGVNADFFDLKTGESENNVIIEGDIMKGVGETDSPHDSYDNLHSQLGIDWRNRPYIDRFGLDARIVSNGKSVRLDGINFRADSGSLVLYTKALGDSAPVDSLGRDFTFVPLRLATRKGDTLVYRIDGQARRGGWMKLSSGGALAAGGSARKTIERIARSRGTVRVIATLAPRRARLRTAIGGWPRLIRDGKRNAEYSDILEGTFPRFSAGRHPRTAIGFSRDSTRLIALVVDGRRESDAGMSLVELADAMLSLGAYDAMAFDGGGSSTMVIEGKVVNRPSDKAGERPVGSGLLFILPR
jgi:phosphodiester glycosidase